MSGSDAEAQRPSGIRRWWRVAVLLVLLFPVIGLLGVNGWLASRWGCAWVAGRIARAVRLESGVGWTSAWPWSGVTVHGVVVLPPEPLRQGMARPLATVDAVRLMPVWRSWMNGRWEVQSLEVDGMRMTLPVELLAGLAAPGGGAPDLGGGGLAARAAAEPTAGPGAPLPLVPEPPAGVGAVRPARPPVRARVAAASAPDAGGPVLPVNPPPPTGWIRFRELAVEVVSLGRMDQPLLQVEGLSGGLPVAGAPADSTLRVGSLRVAGGVEMVPAPLRVSWNAPQLVLGETRWEIGGCGVDWEARLALRPGLPFVFQASAPCQDVSAPVVDGVKPWTVSQGNAAVNCFGYLLAPSSWRGEAAVGSGPVEWSAPGRPRFELTSISLSLQPGEWVCPDMRAVGDRLSVLGNAAVFLDGRFAARMRLVLPPDAAKSVSERAAALLPGCVWGFQPLGGPDRWFSDVSVEGVLPHLRVMLGDGGSVLPLDRAAGLVRALAATR